MAEAKTEPIKCRRQKNGAKLFRSDFISRSMVAAGRYFRRECQWKTLSTLLFSICGQSSKLNCHFMHCMQCIQTQKTLKCYQFTELARSVRSSGSRRQQQWSLSCLRNRDQKHNRTPIELMALVLLIVDIFSSSCCIDRLESHSFTRSTRTVCLCADDRNE